MTYYRELARDEYLENIRSWHEKCKWPFWRKAKNDGHPFVVFGAPSFERILQAAFGCAKGANDSADQKLRQRVRAQLIRSVFDNTPLPEDFVSNAVHRASNPLSFSNNEKFDRNRFLSALATTCAILKHSTYKNKELFDMNIDLARTDRDYLFGRLLGAADKLEEYALRRKSNDRLVTAAIRYMQTFSMRPATTWSTIHDQLLPYIQQVKGTIAFREIESIMKLGAPDVFADDTPLSGLYLVGFYHERAYVDQLVESIRNKQAEDIEFDTTTVNTLNKSEKE
ncbi:MAG: type I-C CRISPR-associated protein Cas8c/Csd1 [Kiritimatiellia bacterium]